MKKLFVLCGIGVLFVSCASTGAKKDFSPVLPAGVVWVSVDGDIRWDGEKKESAGILGDLLNKKIDQSKNAETSAFFSRAATLTDETETMLIEALNQSKVPLIAKEQVLGSVAYQNAEIQALYARGDFHQPEGYRFVDQRKPAFARNLAAETGARGSLYANFVFTKQMLNGVGKNGSMTAAVTMNVFMINADGKVFFKKTYHVKGDDKLPVVFGVYDHKKFVDMIPAVIQTVCSKFAADLL
ncbi:hypothetical protein AGMMS50267_15480 [Spirochaetia bacterium]|nr:hypothetical protein AGMMS50267_15480 [Spirochaetia bacterium]